MKRSKHIVDLFILMLYCLAIASLIAVPGTRASAADTDTVRVQLDAPDEASVGSDFTVRVNISQVAYFDATNYTISFDPTVLSIAVTANMVEKSSDVTEGNINGVIIPVDMTNRVKNGSNAADPRMITIVQNIPGVSGASGSGYLAVLRFQVIGGGGQTTNIGLLDGMLSNTSAQKVQAVWFPDQVKIMPSASTPDIIITPTPTPGSTTTITPTATPTPSVSQSATVPNYSPIIEPYQPSVSPTPLVTTAPSTIPVTPGEHTAIVADSVDREGQFTESISVISEDKAILLTINKGAVGLTNMVDKQPLTEVSITKSSSSQPPPAGYNLVGGSYTLGPEGAVFIPGITVTITYSDRSIPANASEKDMVIAVWDKNHQRYDLMKNSRVDTEKNTVTADIEKYTLLSILAPPKPGPPAYTIMDLAITPAEVNSGEDVNISALVINKGGTGGTYEAVLKINNVVEKTASVELAAGESKRVELAVAKATKATYSVNLNGLTGSFTVKTAPAAATASKTAAKTTRAPVKKNVSLIKQLMEKRWIWGVIGGLVVVAVLVLDRSSKKKTK